MASIFERWGRLYARVRGIDGKWKQLGTGMVAGQEDAAMRWAKEREREVKLARAAMNGGTGELTLAAYVETWLKRRRTKTVGDDRNRLHKHVVRRAIGAMLLAEIRPRHLRDLIEELKAEAELAPKTIREISGLLHTVFKSAIIDELITTNPAVYEPGVLPKKVDKDPTWRPQAIFTRGEVEQIISDARLPEDRRVLYALKFFTGRHGEVSLMTWAMYDASIQPLGALHLGETKSGVPRNVPVHATLAAMLEVWRDAGWESTYGRAPKPDDLIVPTRALHRRKASETQKQFVRDLEKLGLRTKAGKTRKRRGHDLRRTLITLARSDGAIDGVLRLITHGPKPGDMLDLYSTPPWEVLCAELAKLKIAAPAGTLVDGMVRAPRMGATGGLDAVYGDPNGIRTSVSHQMETLGTKSKRRIGTGRVSPPSAGKPRSSTRRSEMVSACDAGLAMMRASARRR